MICASCAAAGDMKKLTEGSLIEVVRGALAERINDLHAECRGGTWCDCQHLGTPSYRRPARV